MYIRQRSDVNVSRTPGGDLSTVHESTPRFRSMLGPPIVQAQEQYNYKYLTSQFETLIDGKSPSCHASPVCPTFHCNSQAQACTTYMPMLVSFRPCKKKVCGIFAALDRQKQSDTCSQLMSLVALSLTNFAAFFLPAAQAIVPRPEEDAGSHFRKRIYGT